MKTTQYHISIVIIILSFLFVQVVNGQVNRFTKTYKKNKRYEVPTENGFNESIKKKKREHWVVYSDKKGNQSYKDSYAQYPNIKIDFLQACYVINEKNDFLELVKYDPGLLPPMKGVLASIFNQGKKLRFAGVKEAEYVGWMHKSQLLMNNNAWVAKENLKPLRYLLKIGDSDVLINRSDFLRQDTVIAYAGPNLLNEHVPEEKFPFINDIVYVYKESKDQENLLIGYAPVFSEETKYAIYGWVDKKMILNIGQQQVLIPRTEEDDTFGIKRNSDFYFKNGELVHSMISNEMDDSTYWAERHLKTLNDKDYLFNRNLQEEGSTAEDQEAFSTYFNTKIWDHTPNKVINILGKFINYDEYQTIKKESKELNIILAFERRGSLKERLLYLTNSIQKIWSILQKDEFAGYHPHFAAICYDDNRIIDEFSFNDTFVKWLDFIQKAADAKYSYGSLVGESTGMKKALYKSAELLKDKSKQTNIVIVAGAGSSIIEKGEMSNLSKALGHSSARLFFWQMANDVEDLYTDFTLSAKALLYKVGNVHGVNKKHYIVDSKLYKKDNVFKLTDEKLNIYLFDSPENSAYQGGIASPNLKKNLHPNLFDQILETLLLQIVEDNTAIIESLDEFFAGIGLERSITDYELTSSLARRGTHDNGIYKLPISSYEDEFLLDYYGIEDSTHLAMEHYFLLSVNEYENYMNNIKRIALVLPEKVNRKFRKKLYKSYKKYYKELRINHGLKDKACETSLAKLIFLANGMAVNDDKYKNIPLRFIKKKKLLTHEELRQYLTELRSYASQLEEYPTINTHSSLKVQNMEYIFVPAQLFP